MKSLSRSLIVFILGCSLLLISSCSPTSNREKYIPEDAMTVLTVNGSKLGKKIVWEVLFSGDLFKNMKSEDAKKTGIDLMNTFYVYALPDQRLSGKVKIIALVPLRNKGDWVAFMKNNYPGFQEKSEQGFHSAPLQANMVAGWNDKTAVLVFTPEGYGSGDNNTPAILSETLNATFHIDEKASISGNTKFRMLQQENYDVGLWLNYERMVQSLSQIQMGMAALLSGQAGFAREGYMVSGFNFEQGKISGDLKYFGNPAMLDIMKQMIPERYNDELIQRMLPGKPAAVTSLHFNPQSIKSMLDTMGNTALINDQLAEQGLTIDGILSCFSGDFLFTASDVTTSLKTETYSYNGHTDTFGKNETSANWMVSFKVKEQAALDKLIQIFINENMLAGKGENLFALEGTNTLMSVRDGYAVITGNEQNISHFFSGPGAGRADIPAEVGNNPIGVFIDMKALAPVFESGRSASSLQNRTKSLLETIVAYGGKISGDHASIHFDINFQNKGENSLLQIIKAATQVSGTEPKSPDAVSLR